MKRARFHFTIQKLEEELFSTRAFHVSCIRNGKRRTEKHQLGPVLVSHFKYMFVRPNFQNHKMLLQCYEHAHFLLACKKLLIFVVSVINTMILPKYGFSPNKFVRLFSCLSKAPQHHFLLNPAPSSSNSRSHLLGYRTTCITYSNFEFLLVFKFSKHSEIFDELKYSNLRIFQTEKIKENFKKFQFHFILN